MKCYGDKCKKDAVMSFNIGYGITRYFCREHGKEREEYLFGEKK